MFEEYDDYDYDIEDGDYEEHVMDDSDLYLHHQLYYYHDDLYDDEDE